MYCDVCGAESDATITCEIKRHPEVLMLLLKRFEFDYQYMTYVKSNLNVKVPFTLQIPENQTYELYAVVDHFGDLRSGHYTATIRSQDDGTWYRFDDRRVSSNQHQPFEVDDFETSSRPYLLLYRMKKDAKVTLPEGFFNLQLNASSLTASQKRKDKKEKNEMGRKIPSNAERKPNVSDAQEPAVWKKPAVKDRAEKRRHLRRRCSPLKKNKKDKKKEKQSCLCLCFR
ncbi:uncharacterized protein LOC134125095 isoform X2 [Pungitius pungitius]|uniref:uncharacterized protein LOC134125095 isoform X2 n=1 Tax=Pungitius pungitius TaxID=134920 RepID=UPI002E146633